MKSKTRNVLPLFWITCLLLNLMFLVGCGDRTIIYKRNIDGVSYKCKQLFEYKDSKAWFTVKNKNDIKEIEVKGYIKAVAVDAKRSVAALLVEPPWDGTRLNYTKDEYWIAIIDTNSLIQEYTWEIIPDSCVAVSHLYHPVMKFSDDGKLLSAYYYFSCENKDIKQKQIISIWSVENGEMVQQISFPKPEPDFPNHRYIDFISDVAISPDNKYVAAYGDYGADNFLSKHFCGPYFQTPMASLLVFSMDDGSLKALDTDAYFSICRSYFSWVFHHDTNLKISWKVTDSGQRIRLPNGKLWGNF